MAQQKQIQPVSMRMQVQSLASLSGLGIQRCHELCVGHRGSLDATLLWLWHKQVAVALVQSLAWELPYASCVA